MEKMKTLLVILVIAVLILLWQNLTMTFKIGYYEQTFKNHRDKFTDERFKQIEDVMDKKSPF